MKPYVKSIRACVSASPGRSRWRHGGRTPVDTLLRKEVAVKGPGGRHSLVFFGGNIILVFFFQSHISFHAMASRFAVVRGFFAGDGVAQLAAFMGGG